MRSKVVFLANSISQPRVIRRVQSIAKMGYEVVVYGYDRKQYNCNCFEDGIEVHVLGSMAKGSGYLHKLQQVNADVKTVVEKHRYTNCLFYSFGFIETLSLRLRHCLYAYEISDIAYASGKLGRLLPLLRLIDKSLVRRSQFTLLTSEGFAQFLNVKSANYIIQPNKVNQALIGCVRTPLALKEDRFVFSFIGSIRYETMMRFARVIGKYFPQHQFHFYGVADKAIIQDALNDMLAKYDNIKLFGAFKNPDDFESIYNSVDIVVTTYGHDSKNEDILDPNKLYEGILFCRPIIATEGTFLAQQVERYGCGVVIDSSSEDLIRDAIELLTADQLNKISLNEKKIEDSFSFDDTSSLESMLASVMNQ